MASFEGTGFEEAEIIHGELFEVFGQDELAGRVRAGGHAAMAGEDIDGLLGESVTDVFKRAFRHTRGS